MINLQRQVNLPSSGTLDGGDPSERVFRVQVDLAQELSKLYSKNIRQGATFKVKGVQTTIRPANNEYDVGLASVTKYNYCPSTSNSRKAWRSMFSTWYSQKKLRAGAVGKYTRYDDLEYAYNSTMTTDRTSTLLMGGLQDGDADQMVLYGSSSENSNIFSLQDHWDSLQTQPVVSRYSWSNDPIKEPKFTSEFPLARYFTSTSEATTIPTFEDGTEVDIQIPLVDVDRANQWTHLGGGNTTADIHLLPECAPVLCGLLDIECWVIPDDTARQYEDVGIMTISIWVESWKNIFATPKFNWRKPRKPHSRKSYSSRYNKSSRRKGRK